MASLCLLEHAISSTACGQICQTDSQLLLLRRALFIHPRQKISIIVSRGRGHCKLLIYSYPSEAQSIT